MARVIAVLAVVLLSMGITGLVHPVPADATQGLDESGSATWTVRPAQGDLVVRAEITVTHTVPDDPDGSYTYWDQYATFLAYAPDDVQVTWGGAAVSPRVEVTAGGGANVRWDLPERLRFGQTRTAVITARFTSGAPRTDQADSPRVDRGYVFAWVHGFGDSSDVTIDLPASMDGTPPAGYEASREANRVRWTTGGWTPTTLDAVIATGDVPTGAVRRVRVAGQAVRIVPLASDPQWGRAMAEFVDQAIPALRPLTGDVGLTATVTIREDARPELAGWAGWYQEDDDTILVGESFDRELWTHELSHHWFNGREFDDVWLIEGLAEYTSARLADRLGYAGARPGLPDPDLALDGWTVNLSPLFLEPGSRDFQEVVARHYDAAHALVRQMATEVDPARFDEVVAALVTERSAFPGPGDEQVDEATSWQELVDLLRAVGGWDGGGDLIVEHVDPTATQEVRRNDEAWDAWEAFTSTRWSHADWAAPLDVRRAMQAWHYERADQAMAQAAALRDEIDRVEAAATGIAAAAPSFQRHWEARPLSELGDALADVMFSVQLVRDLHDDAAAAGLELPHVVERIEFDETDATSLRVAAVREALDAVAGAMSAPRPDGPVARIGLLGADPETALGAARDALAADDLDAARSRAREARAAWDQAGSAGAVRIAIALLALAVVVGLLAVALWRQRRGNAGGDAPATSSEPPLEPPVPAVERQRPPFAPRVDDPERRR